MGLANARSAVTPHDLEAARRSLVDVLARTVVEKDGRAGIPNFVDALAKTAPPDAQDRCWAFAARTSRPPSSCCAKPSWIASPRGERLRRLGETIIASFLTLQVEPPEGEGFHLARLASRICRTGRPEVFLRSFGDDIKALLQAYQAEKRLGRDHPEWLAWCRAVRRLAAHAAAAERRFPALVEAGHGRSRFRFTQLQLQRGAAAGAAHRRRTGDRSTLTRPSAPPSSAGHNGQSEGRFVGGTIDNPDVLDKEAATLSLEAYLHLYDATGDPRWIDRARGRGRLRRDVDLLLERADAGDDDDADRHWKRGVPTVGLQLISTGHSLVDAYMAFDADEFARLYSAHRRHALPRRGPTAAAQHQEHARPARSHVRPGDAGWQQEHWSLAPRRGYGLHRGWLPWVATSQLNGIFGLMDLDAARCEERAGRATQYILFNRAPGQGMNQVVPETLGANSSRKCWPDSPIAARHAFRPA